MATASHKELTAWPFRYGPYVQVACFCDTVLRDDSGALSLIRVIDTLTHTERGSDPPKELSPFTHSLNLVIALKSGQATGRRDLRVIPVLPSSETKPPLVMTVHFEGDEKGHNLVANLQFTFEMEGVYWFDIFVDDDRLTRIPLCVKYNRVVTST